VFQNLAKQNAFKLSRLKKAGAQCPVPDVQSKGFPSDLNGARIRFQSHD
jgi:hypothetical protein